jgi:hypothetical protein
MIYQERFKLDVFSYIVTEEKSETIFGSVKARDGVLHHRNVLSTLKEQKVLGRTNRLSNLI